MSYAFHRRTVGPVVRTLYRMDIRGTEHVPAEGPLVVVANHLSAIDPFVLGASVPRDISFLAKEELFRNPLLAAWLRNLGAIAVARGRGDVGAVDAAATVVEGGGAVAIFPEGYVRRQGPWLRGAARLALTTGTPILPVRLWHTDRAVAGRRVGFPRLRVDIGAPLNVTRGRVTVAAARALTETVRASVSALG